MQTALTLLQTKGGFDVKDAQKFLDELEALRTARELENFGDDDDDDESEEEEEVGMVPRYICMYGA